MKNEGNYGPITCSVLEQCLTSEADEIRGLLTFEVQYSDRLRIHILYIVAEHIKLSCRNYLMLLNS